MIRLNVNVKSSQNLYEAKTKGMYPIVSVNAFSLVVMSLDLEKSPHFSNTRYLLLFCLLFIKNTFTERLKLSDKFLTLTYLEAVK